MIELKIHTISVLIVMLFLVSALCSVGYKASARANQYAVNSQTDVIHVPSANYSTIQEAINHATPGDQILVQAGTYLENIVINKSISLVGEDRERTIINGTQTGAVINITASNVNVTGFTIGKSGLGVPSDSGVFVMYSSFVAITNNKVVKNYEGITVLFCSNVLISDNNISINGYDGISLYSSVNVMVTDNIIFSNFYNGISLYSSGYNSVSGNTVSNSYNGIHFTLSSNNVVYHNNFDNRYDVLSDSTNIWSLGNEGNYWSRYAGQDLNGDGIGDLPFSIDENNQDDYPLMGTFSDFNIALKEEYHVSVISNSTVSDFEFGTGSETGNKIIRFNATDGESTAGFCRIKIPNALMAYPFIVLVDNEEIIPTLLGISSAENSFLYFTYMHSSHTISIISSRVFLLYTQLFGNYIALQEDLNSLNQSYSELLSRYNILSENNTLLQEIYRELNMSYQEHLVKYSELLGRYNILSENNTLLQEIYRELNMSYQEHLVKYSENMQNVQNLIYIFAATTAIFLITTVYLSKRAHANATTKAKLIEEE